MLIELDFIGLFQVFCLVQGFTSAAFLWWGRPSLPGNRWLSLLLLAMTLQVLDYFLSRSGIYAHHRRLYFSPLFFSWAFGPLLLTYGRALLGEPPLRRRHFAPVLLQVVFYTLLAFQDLPTKAWFWQHVHKPWTRYVDFFGTALSWMTYVAATLWLVADHFRRPGWLWRWLLLAGAFSLIATLEPLFNAAYLPPRMPKFYLTGLGIPVLTYALALLGWRESQRRAAAAQAHRAAQLAVAEANAEVVERTALPLPEPVAPTSKAHLPEPIARPPCDPAQVARVLAALETDHLYRNPELTLDALAAHLELSANTVSTLINSGLERSFAELINGYRLEEVKQRLLTPDADRFTVLALAFDAGFNSKSTFNRIFKEKTGQTPREYRKTSQPT